MQKVKINNDKMRGFKIKIYPTEDQKALIDRHIELFRYVYNWGLSRSIEYYAENKEYIGISKLYDELSKIRNENEWLQEIPLHSARIALNHLDNAYCNFFSYNKGFPKYKSKKYSSKTVHYRNESYAFNIDKNSVRIPGFPRNERILCKSHNIPIDAKFYNCTIKFDGINYWLSVNIEIETPEVQSYELTGESLGIDLGIRKFAHLSNGKIYRSPKILKTLTKRQSNQQKRLSKMRERRIEEAIKTKTKLEDIPYTKNEAKLKDQNTKLKIRIKNIRRSFLHQTTSEIVHTYPSRIIIEDLNVTEMVQSNFNNRDEVFHSMWYKFREYITYKSKYLGIDLVVADKAFPSSQICSRCGYVKKSSYTEYICPICGLRIDRDLNAAINLSKYMA